MVAKEHKTGVKENLGGQADFVLVDSSPKEQKDQKDNHAK